MGQILADTEVKKLLGSVIYGTDEKFLNPNGIELRLGQAIKFHSTNEEFEVHPGEYVKIKPGESVYMQP